MFKNFIQKVKAFLGLRQNSIEIPNKLSEIQVKELKSALVEHELLNEE
jgi:alpha-ketoglutarate-dependent taurine dioxygenase